MNAESRPERTEGGAPEARSPRGSFFGSVTQGLNVVGTLLILAMAVAVNAAVASLKGRGFESPYLKAFVVARINPLRFKRKPTADFDETIDKMIGTVRRFEAGKIKADQIARTGGPPVSEE